MRLRTFKDSLDANIQRRWQSARIIGVRILQPTTCRANEVIAYRERNSIERKVYSANAFVYDAFSKGSFSCTIILTSSGRDRACIFSIARLL